MAEIGRISGPLLKENLLRDTVNFRVESNLLYFDVNTHAADVNANPSDPSTWTGRLGIHTSNPAYQLDVVGTTRSNALLVKPNSIYTNAYADIDNIRLDGNRIQAIVGNLELGGATLTDRVEITTNTLINANLEVTGNITLGGSINIGDQNTDEVVFGADIASNLIPDSNNTYDLGTLDKAWRNLYANNIEIVGNIGVGQIAINGNTITTIESNANLELDTAGTGTIELKSSSNVTGDLTVSGDVAVNGGDITTNQTSFNLINGTATTVQAFGAAELLVFASSTGTTTFRSDVVINNDLQIKGGDLTTNASTFNLLNNTPSTVNFADAATTINIGAAAGTTTVRNDLQVNGNVDVVGDVTIGGNLTLGNTTFDSITVVADFTSDLIPDTADTYNLGTPDQAWKNVYATNIEITGNLGLSQIAIDGNRISTTESNADLEFDTSGAGRYVFIGSGGVILPVGNTAERPTPPQIGMMRFNTDDQRVENYNGEEWNRMVHDDDAIAFAIALG